jgi:cyclic dehypoxanthinyl futalosine synthase
MPDAQIQKILEKRLNGGRLSTDDCTALLESYDIASIGAAADEIRQRRHPDQVVTYIIDRNINYTNVCNVVCTFCAFYRRPGRARYLRAHDRRNL